MTVTLEPDDLLTITRHAKLAAVLHALTVLGVPDALRAGPMTAEAVAAEVGARTEPVGRLLRAAASEGALEAGPDGHRLTPFSRRLCADDHDSFAAMLVGWGTLRAGQVGLAHLDVVAREGGSGVEAAYGGSFHEHLQDNAEQGRLYAAAMESTVESFEASAAAYDFSRFDTVVDVGGGRGGLLAAVLRTAPAARGILFDLPHVVAGAPDALAGLAERDRIDVVGGDLFRDLPAGADAYLYSTVLRCFDDDACLAALRACADAVRPGGTVLAVEMVMAEGVPPSPSGLADVYAMAVYGGKDRTRSEWATLLDLAGFSTPDFHRVGDGPFHVVAATRC